MSNDDYPHGRWSPPKLQPKPMDSSNQFQILPSSSPDWLMVGKPIMGVLTKDDAINLAAWLVVIADPERKKFQPLIKELLGEK